jgi:putative endonuclease
VRLCIFRDIYSPYETGASQIEVTIFMFARLIFSIVSVSARKGLSAPDAADSAVEGGSPAKQRALRTGLGGETYAYLYLRRQGYVLIARNFISPGLKGEIDMAGYDGSVLAFVEVKTRPKMDSDDKRLTLQARAESAVNTEKRRNISPVAPQFLRARHIESTECRFDVSAIKTRPGEKPPVRLHKGAFNAGEHRPRRM